MRLLALLAALLLIAMPVSAVETPTYTVPPVGTVVIAYAVSDGMTLLPVGTSMVPAGTFCP